MGLTNAQTVERTALSTNSIKSHICSGYRRIGIDSRCRAVLRSVDHGIQLDRVGVSEPDIPGSNSSPGSTLGLTGAPGARPRP